MAKMQCDRRTVQRARAAAERAGLLDVDARASHNGQASNLWRINWGRLHALQELPPMGGETPPPRGETPPPRGETPPPLRNISRASYRLLGPSNIRSSGAAAAAGPQRAGDDQKFPDRTEATRGVALPEIDVAAVRGMAARIERKIGRRQSRGDWSLACKAAILAAVLGEHWLWDVVEAVVRKRPPAERPWAYLHRCLAEGARTRGVRLARELSRIALPPTLDDDGARARDEACEFAERLCTREDS